MPCNCPSRGWMQEGSGGLSWLMSLRCGLALASVWVTHHGLKDGAHELGQVSMRMVLASPPSACVVPCGH